MFSEEDEEGKEVNSREAVKLFTTAFKDIWERASFGEAIDRDNRRP